MFRYRLFTFFMMALLSVSAVWSGEPIQISLNDVGAVSTLSMEFSDLIVTIENANSIASGDVVLSITPFTIRALGEGNPFFDVSWVNEPDLSRMTLQRIDSSPINDPIQIHFELEDQPQSKLDATYGFGEFSIIGNTLKDSENRIIEDVSYSSGSWMIMSDYSRAIPISLINRNSEKPVAKARINFVRLVGGPAFSESATTDDQGKCELPYLPDDYYLLAEGGDWTVNPIVKADLDIQAVFHIAPTEESVEVFDPFDVTAPLTINQKYLDEGYLGGELFAEIEIEIPIQSAVQHFSLY